ncbi:MAG: ribonuclease PH, partial [Burkholderiaceae bacterium]
NVVMTGQGGFVEVQGTAEGQTFDKTELEAMLELAGHGIKTLVQLQRSSLKET